MKAKITITETFSKVITVPLPDGVDLENAQEWAETRANEEADPRFDAHSTFGVADYGDMDFSRNITVEEV